MVWVCECLQTEHLLSVHCTQKPPKSPPAPPTLRGQPNSVAAIRCVKSVWFCYLNADFEFRAIIWWGFTRPAEKGCGALLGNSSATQTKKNIVKKNFFKIAVTGKTQAVGFCEASIFYWHWLSKALLIAINWSPIWKCREQCS